MFLRNAAIRSMSPHRISSSSAAAILSLRFRKTGSVRFAPETVGEMMFNSMPERLKKLSFGADAEASAAAGTGCSGESFYEELTV